MSMSVHRIVRELEKKGWRVRRGTHYVCYAPTGEGIVTISVTVSDNRAIRNILHDLARYGFTL